MSTISKNHKIVNVRALVKNAIKQRLPENHQDIISDKQGQIWILLASGTMVKLSDLLSPECIDRLELCDLANDVQSVVYEGP